MCHKVIQLICIIILILKKFQGWVNVGLPSATLAKHWSSTGLTSHVCISPKLRNTKRANFFSIYYAMTMTRRKVSTAQRVPTLGNNWCNKPLKWLRVCLWEANVVQSFFSFPGTRMVLSYNNKMACRPFWISWITFFPKGMILAPDSFSISRLDCIVLETTKKHMLYHKSIRKNCIIFSDISFVLKLVWTDLEVLGLIITTLCICVNHGDQRA